MRFRITTGLSAEEIRDALSKHIEPKVIFRNYLQNKPKLFEGNISTTNFELRRIETHRSITKVTLQGNIIKREGYNIVDVSALYPWTEIIIYSCILLYALYSSYNDLTSLFIILSIGFIIFIFGRGKYIMDTVTGRDEIFKIIKGNSIENI
ncbi:hypothetical protein [Elizabethkingia anophelis]|uniref:hypothetical protein n=1 Tax=Elizabethkingia anophelis TaxID=1117645 RepID=UPI00136E3B1F|nr:hypothetical protein [Elizabethkingia anophelis]MCL1033244.1 hypothetical protein [Elizabethkingia anophelis]MCT3699978.1 hypothetical protein [Elizabethkingia anophelis]MCT4123401.1 hypothetical protein [Elizabethkingia anophelis]MCT4325391.1 hypothetical protein [Elizabethkingia anophelis]MCW2464795.1 hypothetical protein [Elizabethkingia anophelis]